MLQQDPADDRTQCAAHDRHGAPDRDRHVALALVLEGDADQRERGGHHRGRPDGKEGPRGDQGLRTGGERRDERRRTEDHEADQEHPPVPHPVAERSAAQQQTGHHDRVGVDDPESLGAARAEILHQGRQGRVQDGVVQRDQQQPRAHHCQEQPAPLRADGHPVWPHCANRLDLHNFTLRKVQL